MFTEKRLIDAIHKAVNDLFMVVEDKTVLKVQRELINVVEQYLNEKIEKVERENKFSA